MRANSIALLFLVSLIATAMPGCAFLAGTGTGAVGAGAAYEVNAGRELDRLEDDYKDGKITRKEYEARKEQIKRGSLVY